MPKIRNVYHQPVVFFEVNGKKLRYSVPMWMERSFLYFQDEMKDVPDTRIVLLCKTIHDTYGRDGLETFRPEIVRFVDSRRFGYAPPKNGMEIIVDSWLVGVNDEIAIMNGDLHDL